jgi:hypothetical protein
VRGLKAIAEPIMGRPRERNAADASIGANRGKIMDAACRPRDASGLAER